MTPKLFIDLANYILMRMRYLVFRMWIRFVLIIILVFLLRVFHVLRTVRIVTSVRKPMRNGLILLMKLIIFFRYLFDKFQQRLLQMFLWRCFLYRHGSLHIPWMIYDRHRWMMRILVLLFLGWRMMFSLPESNWFWLVQLYVIIGYSGVNCFFLTGYYFIIGKTLCIHVIYWWFR